MTAPDPYLAGLDPAHIVAICAQATGGRRSLAVGAPDGICVCLPSRRAARAASAALSRVGYQVAAARGGRGRDLMVTGWSPAGLETRLTAMRGVLHRLAGDPSGTAAAVIERFRALPAKPATPSAGPEILQAAGTQLRGWVYARSGIHAPCDPAVVPADVGVAVRLRATWALEQVIEDLTERHLRVAGHALALFGSLREPLGDDLAGDRAICSAGVTFHLSGTTAQTSSPLIQGAAPASGGITKTPTSSAARPAGRPRASTARAVVREFPFPFTALDAATGAGCLSPAQPGRQARPAERPRRRR